MTDTGAIGEASDTVDLQALHAGDLDYDTLDRFRSQVFRSTRAVDSLRSWLTTPLAVGLARDLVLWALGRHEEAVRGLSDLRSNPVIADCLGHSYAALGRFDDAQRVLTRRATDPRQAFTWLLAVETQYDAHQIKVEFDRHAAVLRPADRLYVEGRGRELARDVEGAIACYDQVLALDSNHKHALFRLAFNVDLHGEDEEARELYERSLMAPPVNAACVINLGVLYEDIGNYRRAMQCFDLALQADPESARARLYRRDAAAALNMYYDEEQERSDVKRDKLMRTSIHEFELSVRSRGCLESLNIRTIGDLVVKTEADLLGLKNFGETSLTEIKEVLKKRGLRLGMTPDDLRLRELGVPDAAVTEPGEQPDPHSPDPLRRPIAALDLSVRSRRIIDLLKIRTVGDLADKTQAELLTCPNFGQTSLNEIKTKLADVGASLRT
jgi:DNA-directed RNA polymerase subunit alpha